MARIQRLIHEIHHRSLWQVLLIYLGASWAVLQVADQIVTRFALPEWVYAAALLLLLIGLPIVLATAFVQEGIGGHESPDAGGSGEAGSGRTAGAARGAPRAPRRLLTWRNAIAGGVLAFAVWGVAAAGWLLLGPGRPSGASAAEEADRRSIAVLPFANRSAEEGSEFFVDGMHDDILTQLSKIGSLKVISRTSVTPYRDTGKSMREIAGELGVATVMEGGVERAGSRVRINVQLIDARTDEHLWAEAYDRELTAENLFAIRSEVARQIAEALEATLAPEVAARIEKQPTESLEAYDLYLQGRYLWSQGGSKDDHERAIRLFQRAIEADPGFPLAYSGLADTYLPMVFRGYLPEAEGLPLARAAAERALALDEGLSEAFTSRASVASVERRWEEAERDFRRALELDPGYATAHRRYGNLLSNFGRHEEAIREMRRAVELDPLSPVNRTTLASAHFWARDYDGAMAEARRLLELRPDSPDPWYELGFDYAMKGEHEQAIAALSKAAELDPENPDNRTGLAYAYARAGRRAEALETLAQAERQGASKREIALVYGELGDIERAFEYLERAWVEEPGSLVTLKVDPTADPLRSDPRFAEIIRRVGLE